MRSLNPDQLRTLSEVAATGSFSAAARRLNLSQPAVSQQIRELETRFGVTLLERMGKRAFPTEPGRMLIEHGARILSACDEALTAMRRYRDGWIGRVTVGTTLTALMYSLPPILRHLRTAHPGIELVVVNMPTADSLEGVLQNTLDLALVTLPVDDARLRVTPLRYEVLVALLPDTFDTIPDIVTPAYAVGQPLVLEHERGAVYRLVMEWMSAQLPLASSPIHIGMIEAAKKGVASGLGMAFVPDVAAAEPIAGVIVRPMKPSVPCTLALIEHRHKPDNEALAIVRDAMLALRQPDRPRRRTRSSA
jgi:DNA-binding transcriptional LysR family regulator